MSLARAPAPALAMLVALGPVAMGQRLTAALAVSAAEHRVDAGAGIEVSAGPLFTVGAQSVLGRRWIAGIEATTGALAAGDGGGPDRDVAQLRASLAFRATPWLNVAAGFGTRTYTAAIARQRWTALSFGADARLPFAGGHFSGIGRIALQPFLGVSGLDAPNAAVTAAAGAAYGAGTATVALLYWLERYDFPPAAGATRREQLAGLMVQATWSPVRAR